MIGCRPLHGAFVHKTIVGTLVRDGGSPLQLLRRCLLWCALFRARACQWPLVRERFNSLGSRVDFLLLSGFEFRWSWVLSWFGTPGRVVSKHSISFFLEGSSVNFPIGVGLRLFLAVWPRSRLLFLLDGLELWLCLWLLVGPPRDMGGSRFLIIRPRGRHATHVGSLRAPATFPYRR